MSQKVSVINIEESIGKTVGRRRPPSDPFSSESSSIKRTLDWQKALPVTMPPRGVFRFHSHEEANQWWTKMTAPNKNR